MKKLFLILVVLLVLTGCQTKQDPDYRILNDEKYIQVSENRFEYESKWMEITDIVGGYQIAYSNTSIVTKVISSTTSVVSDTCTLTRQPSSLFETDCNETERAALMTYISSVTLHEGEIITVGNDNNILGHILLIIFLLILSIIFGLLGFNRDLLNGFFEFKAFFKFKYSDKPRYADWFIDNAQIGFKAGFIISVICLVITFVFLLSQ